MHATITNAREKGDRFLQQQRYAKRAIGLFLVVSVLISIRYTMSGAPVWKPGELVQGLLLNSTQTKKTMGKFEVFRKTTDKHYYFQLKASNGEIILESQGYVSKQSCMAGIESVQTNAPLDQRYERKDGKTKWSFNLKAANGEVIGQSQSYTSSGARENGIRSVKHNARLAKIEELADN